MKKVRYYSCDGGTLLIGNASCRFSAPNGYGDGRHKVVVTDNEKDIEEAEKRNGTKSRWVGRIEGDAINVYDYDCYDSNELYESVLFTLHGAFSIYAVNGDVFLLKVPIR